MQSSTITRPLKQGKTDTIMNVQALEAGSTTKFFTIDSDSVLLSLFVDSVAGDLDVTASTLISQHEPSKSVEIVTFPTVSAPTTNLLIQKAATALSIVSVTATYTGACSFVINAKGTSLGESSVRIVGSPDFETNKFSVSASPTVIIAPSLADQTGILLKNFSTNRNIFVAESSLKASDAGGGYPLAPGEVLMMDVSAGSSIYASTDSAPADLRIVRTGG